ncbi:MAG: PQQ-binding-like beta-propeller repeat protein [Bacillota bacterium]|nr:PQQ-binding-like beta-propeller repeat protein [Bacillota bacterium]
MINYRKPIMKKLLGFILSIMLVVSMLPANIFAAEEVNTGRFILVAEAQGKLVIPPEYISYEEGRTIGEALSKSGHVFTGLDVGWITEIDGVVGNYTRSDENGDFNLGKSASEIGFFRFCEDEENSKPSEGMMKLMTSMAEYQEKADDVKAAAKAAYDDAYAQFVGIDDYSAMVLADKLDEAISKYEALQNSTKYQITFSDGIDAHKNADITVKNVYGKVWNNDGDGIIELPAGDYTFAISEDGLHAEGTMTVDGSKTIKAPLPEKLWLDRDTFRLSGSYGAEDNEENKFSDDEYEIGGWNGRSAAVAVSDTFTGSIYTYAEYDGSAVTGEPVLTAIYTSAKTGKIESRDIPFESLNSGISNVLTKGAEGNSVTYRMSCKASDGYVYSQDYTVDFQRIPTLKSISVKDQEGVDQAATTSFDPERREYTYNIIDTVTELNIEAAPLDESYSVKIDGKNAVQGVAVQLSSDSETSIPITVDGGEYSNTYNLIVRPAEGKKLSFVTDRTDVTLKVVNSNGQVMPYAKFREGDSGNRYQYTLVPGETYSYVATAATYYHIADEFTMEDVADSTINVDVPEEDWLTELAFGTSKASSKKGSLLLDSTFESSDHEYKAKFIDNEHNVYVWATADSNVKVEAVYDQVDSRNLYHGKEKAVSLTSGSNTGVQLNRLLMDENPIENAVVIRLSKDMDGVEHYQDYVVDFQRILSLKDISVRCDGLAATLIQEDDTEGFKPSVKEYSVTVSMAAKNIDLSFVRNQGYYCYGEDEIGYIVKVDGVDVTDAGAASIPLDGTLNTQDVTVTVENHKAPEGTTEYIIHILKSPPVDVDFSITPDDALLAMYETMSGERLWPIEDGKFRLCEGYSYNYALTAYGHVSKTGTLTVMRDDNKNLIVKDGEDSYKVSENSDGGGYLSIDWTLAKADINSSIRTDMESQWSNFRGSETNNSVTDAAIPVSAENGTLYWANKIGNGYSADAVGSPILVDGDLITYAGSNIYRVDTITGEIKVTGNMTHKSAHATTPPSYAEGMVFVALTDGTIQAFNAETLESLWIYKDPLGGQPVCPLTIKNGYLYTGFWNSEKGDANFVCLSITDEDPDQINEEKSVSWYYTSNGGYYWAGAYCSDEFVLIGTDDGGAGCTDQTSKLLMFDPSTGKLLDSWTDLDGDIRSSIVYDEATDAYYFTSKGGSFYSLKVKKIDAGWAITDKWSVKLDNDTEGTPMSTCSPTVYNGRAYVGVSGEGQFSAYSGHNISVIDLSQKKVAYKVQTQGYPQTSGLLTTAYEKESGYVYIYFFDNMTPGKLRVLRDKAGQTKADYVTTEGNYSTAYALFTPTGDQAQYAICSPIVDEYGTIYFKNDSAHMMAFGSTIKKIEVTKKPDKMKYEDGEAFDPKGMVVTATYANGKTRDITSYVTYDTDKITEEKTTVTISFPYVMYQNQENGTEMTSGVFATTPVTTIEVAIGTTVPDEPNTPDEPDTPAEIQIGDVDLDGYVDTQDAGLVISYYYETAELTAEQISKADVNGDGQVDTDDAGLIISYYYGNIERFPSKAE